MTHKYIGTKEVLAWEQEKDGKAGYAVKYADGYISWSPKETFDAAYRIAEGAGQSLTFGDAVHFLKAGLRVTRDGWNGKGMFLFLVPGSHFTVNRAPLLGIYPEGTGIDYRAHIDMKTAQGDVVPWVASQSDILADDWTIVSGAQA